MKKILAIAIVTGCYCFNAYATTELSSVNALNGVKVNLTGDFYNPNLKDIVQKNTPVITFEGLTYAGGKQIVQGYKNAFNENIMGMYIDKKLKEVSLSFDTTTVNEILKGIPIVEKQYPELINFYKGIAEESKHSLADVYLAAWAEEGTFALDIKKEAAQGLASMAESLKTERGCTAIGWTNGVIGENQDMSIKLSGYGTIWKSPDIIVHAATPLYTAMSMGKNIATVTNTVDNFNNPSLEKGAPNGGVTMAIVQKFKTTPDVIEALKKIKLNSAYSPTFVDKKGGLVTIEVQDSGIKVMDGTEKGYTVHTNHPVGKEKELVEKYAGGDYKMFDNLAANTLWRYQQAELHAKFSPTQNVDSIKDLLTQKPIFMAPRKNNDFVSVNSVIHDLHAGCTYGTTWMSTIQDYKKVCFEKKREL